MGTFKTQMLWEAIRKGDLTGTIGLLESGNINLEERDGNGQTFLMLACEFGELNIVRELLEAHVDPNAVDMDNWSALLYSAKEGHLEIVIELLERGADIEHKDMCGWTALMWACYKGKYLVVQELLERGANCNIKAEMNMTCLAWAAGRGHTDVVKILIQKGAKVNTPDKYGTTPLIWACRKGYLEIVETLLNEGANTDVVGMNSWTALLVAAKGGFTEVVHQLLEYDPNVNAVDKDGFTGLTIAAKEGYTEIAHDLLSKGAYVNIKDRAGDTILIHAVKGGHIEVVRALIDKYADIDEIGAEGKTALYWSVEKGYVEICKLLLNNDPDLEIANKDEDTPLLRAVRSRNEPCVRLLLDKGARVSAVDKRGDTALHISLRARSKRITELLLRNPRNSRLLYRPNKAGETPYNIDAYHQKGILTQIFGHRNLNANDGENLLGYEVYSSALADILSEPSLNTPITVGLYAKWGSGKSFLLSKLQKEMRTFTRANKEDHFTFSWTLFIILLLLNNLVGLTLAMTVGWEVGLGVGLGLFLLDYLFLGVLYLLCHRYNLKYANRLSLLLGRKIQVTTSLLQVLFLNSKQVSTSSKYVEPSVKFLFSEGTKLTSVGGEKALAAMIGTLGEALEQEYGSVVARLFRVFKPHPDKPYTGRFKTLCCVPYFVIVYLVCLALEIGAYLLVSHFAFNQFTNKDPIYSNTTTVSVTHNQVEEYPALFGVLFSIAIIVGLAIIGNIYTWGQAILALLSSQRRRIMKAADRIDKIKVDGLMHILKCEVDLMAKMVTFMDKFTENQTRLVVIVDGLDSCEQDKVLHVLDIIKALFSDEDSPFITLLAIDPHIIIKGIESNIKTAFQDSNVNGYDYLRNVVHLPFYLQSQGMAIKKQDMAKSPSTFEVSGNPESPSKTRRSYQHQESVVSGYSTGELSMDKTRRQRQSSVSHSYTSSMDLTNTVTKTDYFSDINPRSMRRLMNIVAITARLLRAYNIDFNWHRLAAWINIIEQWPYRVSWIIIYFEENEIVDHNTTLLSLYEKVEDKIPVSKEIDPLLEIDRNPRKMEAFLSSKLSNNTLLNVKDLRKFLPCTINLDPYLRKLIREMQKNMDSLQPNFPLGPMNFPPPAGTAPTPTRRSEVQRHVQQPFVPMPQMYPQPRLDQIGRMHPMMPYNMMPFYQQGYMDAPYLSGGTAPSTGRDTQKGKGVDPESAIQNYRDQALSTMTVENVCNLIENIKGLNPQQVQAYQNRIVDNNICGMVLSTCDVEELKGVLEMKFGDWQLFKSVLIGLRQREMTHEEVGQFEPGFNKDGNEASAGFESASSQSSNGFSQFSERRVDKKGGQEPFPQIVKAEISTPRMNRIDSAYQQVAFETGLLREAMNNFTEELEEDQMRPNVSFALDTKGPSLDDMDDGSNFSESQPLLRMRPSSQVFSDSRRKESLCVVHEAEEHEAPTAMFYLNETDNASSRESVREGGASGIPLVTFHRGDQSKEEHV
ncbi:kinase D-interacting substrate of 220 kDa-like isoform X1 [Saccostrea echinata]|uniref:kinase D-interacting substrate of 220 kDa-like isoform X1 n=2 Tax=Saccostrea echinata TaxID=191078 RepID=UPI002A836A3D|nr:kinase D-interacting substrate of 220 kDa-like isoform X1 [Saccostrea echinata]